MNLHVCLLKVDKMTLFVCIFLLLADTKLKFERLADNISPFHTAHYNSTKHKYQQNIHSNRVTYSESRVVHYVEKG